MFKRLLSLSVHKKKIMEINWLKDVNLFKTYILTVIV